MHLVHLLAQLRQEHDVSLERCGGEKWATRMFNVPKVWPFQWAYIQLASDGAVN